MTSFQGNWLLLKFFFTTTLRLKNVLPREIQDPPHLISRMVKNEDFRLRFPAGPAVDYNGKMKELKKCLMQNPPGREFKSTLGYLFAIRLATVFAMYFDGPISAFLISCLQFVVAPYSLFVSFANLVLLCPAIFACHYLGTISLQLLLSYIIPPSLASYGLVTITPTFIVVYLLVDQLLCFWVMYRGGDFGVPGQKFSTKRIFTSVIFGFMNCKTYQLVLFGAVLGCQINMWVWIADMVLGLSAWLSTVLSRKMHWSLLFYTQHRLAHLPRVYENAHKQHHYLYDSTPFDAHIYGSGQAEEWFGLCLEAGAMLAAGVYPPSVGYHALWVSWSNKVGHLRKQDSSGGANHHTDHHIYHSKNFGIFNCLMDMYFGTNSDNNVYHSGVYQITRSVETEAGATVVEGETISSKDFIVFDFKISDSGMTTQQLEDLFYPSGFKMVKRMFGQK